MKLLEQYLQEIQEPTNEFISVGTALTAYSLFSIASTLFKTHVLKAGRRCKSYSGAENAVCITTVKIEGKEQELRSLGQNLNKCGNGMCRQRVSSKILKVKEEIASLKEKLKIYEGKADVDSRMKEENESNENEG